MRCSGFRATKLGGLRWVFWTHVMPIFLSFVWGGFWFGIGGVLVWNVWEVPGRSWENVGMPKFLARQSGFIEFTGVINRQYSLVSHPFPSCRGKVTASSLGTPTFGRTFTRLWHCPKHIAINRFETC